MVHFSHALGTLWYWEHNVLGELRARHRRLYLGSFSREIARPIGIQDYRPTDGQYVLGAASIYPCYMVRMSARASQA